MKKFISFISEASIIDKPQKYPPGTEVVLKSGGAFGKRLIDEYGYEEGQLFTIESSRTASTNTIDLSGGEEHSRLKVRGEDGYVFLLKGSKNAIQNSFGELSASGGSGKLNATHFEVDIVNEILKRNGKPISNKKANGTDKAKDLAKRVVDSLSSVAGKPTSAFTLSGNPKKASLTDIYRKFGVTSGESKTDIGIVVGKRHLCTVKKKEGSQFASAQANECSAVIQVVFMDESAKKQALAKSVAQIVKQGMTKENFYELRREDKKFDELLATVVGLRSGATLKPGDMLALQEMLKKTGLSMRITSEIANFLQDDQNKKAVFTEFITGSRRFVNKDYIPDTLFAWGSDGTVVWKGIYEYIDEAYSRGAFKYNIRDRGTQRGGALRLEPIRMEEMNSEEKALYDQLVEEFDKEMDSLILQEGVLDSIRSGLSKVGSAAMAVVRWVAEAAKKLWSFIAALISKGIGVLMEVFGIEATATIQHGPY